MPKRPPLRIGDVCRFSKRSAYLGRRSRNSGVFVVTEVCGDDPSDGRTWFKGHLTYTTRFGAKRTKAARIARKELWFTGYNISQKDSKPAPTRYRPVGDVKNNDGRTHCYKCGQPTTFVPGAVNGGYHMCKNKSCEWYDN